MTIVTFISSTITAATPFTTKVKQVDINSEGTFLTLTDDQKIHVAPEDISQLGFVEGADVTIDKIAYPADSFSITLLPVKKAKTKKTTEKPHGGSPTMGTRLCNGWDF